MKRFYSFCLAVILCIPFLFACAETQADTEPETITEGADTVCEITGYSRYSGPFASAFLSEGDRIAVISPSSIPSAEQTDATIEGLKNWGYIPVEGKYLRAEEHSMESSLADLKWALTDPSIKAVFCVRGGYGASELMDVMPEKQIARAGKLIIGYSDVTVFHSAWTAAGTPSIHASMSAAFMDLPAECVEAERKILQGEIPEYQCAANDYCREGTAEGVLIGGNLSTYTAVLDTVYESSKIDEPYILFFEETGESIRHIHRYLTVLKHNGVLDKAKGIVFGEWTEIPSVFGVYDGRTRGGQYASVADMICRQFLSEYDIPVAFGFPAGHAEVNYPLLMGEKAVLTVSKDCFTLKWD